MWVRSSVVEHGIADPMVAGSIPVSPFCFVHDIYISTKKVRGYGATVNASDSRPEDWGFKSL